MRRCLPLAWERFMRLHWIWVEQLWFALNMLHNFSRSMTFSHIFFYRAFIHGTLHCAHFYLITILIGTDTNTWFVLLSNIFHWIIGTQPHRRCAGASICTKYNENSIDRFNCTGYSIRPHTLKLNAMGKKKKNDGEKCDGKMVNYILYFFQISARRENWVLI